MAGMGDRPNPGETTGATGAAAGATGSAGRMSEEQGSTGGAAEQTWSERIEVAGNELIGRVQELIQESNVRRLIIRYPDGRSMLEIPLTAGVAVGGALTLFYPVLAALGAVAALVAKVKIEVVREGGGPGEGDGPGSGI